jgi:hypothetical protein
MLQLTQSSALDCVSGLIRLKIKALPFPKKTRNQLKVSWLVSDWGELLLHLSKEKWIYL